MKNKRIGGEPFPENKAVQEIKSIDGPTPFQAKKAVLKRADWLKYCLDIGWSKDQLDGLAKIWDDNHDEFGNLIKSKSEPVNTSMSEKEEPSEAWKAWERENKHHTSGINPHAFILGYKAAKSEPAVSQDQEPVFTKSRVFALLQEIEDDIDEQAEEGSLDRRQVKQRINNYFKEMFNPID